MATSRRGWPAWFDSRPHYLGSGGGALGLVVALVAHTGAWAPAVVVGLYAAGAVLGLAFQPTGTGTGGPAGVDLAAKLRRELAEQHTRVLASGWPEADERTARLLVEGVGVRVGPDSAQRLRTVVDAVVPAELDRYERSSSWWRLEPVGAPPGAEFAERVRLVLDKLP
ncbi:hypothetical protein P3T37_001935 [Kitasatospora sp. MAA4]|uniref:hypothetical protein n=1 Tax=Kitasatospora sp. MAA4 TaxID=3035093 RepID=UPI002476A1B1|nr:hypothetical protein [Kitasatospora sp. MAA4]MDH6132550.1 hypothetical protein [Kitasatospora sp. MAA4]